MKQIPQNDFLKLTLQHPDHLDAFDIEHEHYQIQVWDTGVMFVTPKNPVDCDRNKALVLASAVHGNETAPIEIVNDMITNILSGNLKPVHPTLYLFGNPPSIIIGKRFVKENMNRLFSGYHSKGTDAEGNAVNDERIRAKKLEGYVTRFFDMFPGYERTHYDLHTAIRDSAHEKFAVYPYLHGKPWQREQFEILRSMGVKTVLIMKAPATTFSYYASNTHGAYSFTIELGKVRPFGENDQSKFAAARDTLISLVEGREVDPSQFSEENFQIMEVYRSINRNHQDFVLNFPDDEANFTEYQAGDVLAIEDGVEIKADVDGEAIVFPNADVDIGQRALLTVIPTSVMDNLN